MADTTHAEVTRLAADSELAGAMELLLNNEVAAEYGGELYDDATDLFDTAVLEFYVKGHHYGQQGFTAREAVIVLGTGGPHHELTMSLLDDDGQLYGHAYWGGDQAHHYLGTFPSFGAWITDLADMLTEGNAR